MTVRRVAIVGCGLIGTKRAAALPAGLELAVVHDRDRRRAERLAAGSAASPKIADDVVEAVEMVGPDGLVIVATQHDSLVEPAIHAVDGGCHVLVEKPGARTASELQLLANRAQSAGRTVRVGFNHRFHPAISMAHDAMTSGRRGPILLIRARYGHGGRRGYEREWRMDPERSGGGELLDQGVHLLDLVHFLAGPPTLRYAALRSLYWPDSVEDNAFLHLGLQPVGEAWLHASWTEWKNTFSVEITCRTSKLEINGLGGSYGPERLTVFELPDELGPPRSVTTEWPPGDDSWRMELQDVAGAIDGGPSKGASLDDALLVLRLVDAAYGR